MIEPVECRASLKRSPEHPACSGWIGSFGWRDRRTHYTSVLSGKPKFVTCWWAISLLQSNISEPFI